MGDTANRVAACWEQQARSLERALYRQIRDSSAYSDYADWEIAGYLGEEYDLSSCDQVAAALNAATAVAPHEQEGE